MDKIVDNVDNPQEDSFVNAIYALRLDALALIEAIDKQLETVIQYRKARRRGGRPK